MIIFSEKMTDLVDKGVTADVIYLDLAKHLVYNEWLVHKVGGKLADPRGSTVQSLTGRGGLIC